MTKTKNIIACLAVLLTAVASTNWLIQRPKRITETFVGHISQERYEAADQMLHFPSGIKVVSKEELTLVDCSGNSTTVSSKQLPFLAGGGKPNDPSDFSMTALQDHTNGLLNSPAVVVYLSIEGSKIHIERVDSL